MLFGSMCYVLLWQPFERLLVFSINIIGNDDDDDYAISPESKLSLNPWLPLVEDTTQVILAPHQ